MVPRRRMWSLLQGVALLGLAGTFVAFALLPDPSLTLFWTGIVPLLPILFLIHPGLWRNVCPLATLGMGPGTAPQGPVDSLGWKALALLLLLIPLRPLGMEESALASAGLLGAAVGGALLGRRFSRKAGFCNGWCPVLAVERLYGQSPLVELENPRCPKCTVCTPRGCLDLSTRAATAQMLGPGRRGAGWLMTPLGIFAVVFPGVVVGFFTLPTGASPMETYGWVLGGGLLTGLTLGAVSWAARLPWRVGMPTLGALAAGAYLWFALPGMAQAWGAPGLGTPLAWIGVGLAAVWWGRALPAVRRAAG